MYRCPKCGREFDNRDEARMCAETDFEPDAPWGTQLAGNLLMMEQWHRPKREARRDGTYFNEHTGEIEIWENGKRIV